MRWIPSAAATAALVGCLLGSTSDAAAQGPVDPEPVKAAFVQRFSQFVEWPESAFDGDDSLVICAAAPRQFLSTLREVIAENEAGSRTVVAREVRSPAQVEACHVLFISQMVDDPERFLAASRTLPVLTVGDSTAFWDAGGIIQLRILDQRIRFAIDAAAASRVGLRLSSQLLDLAIEVRGAGE